MGLLEDSLRQTFGVVAAAAPATEDLAGRAIASARRTRRHRMMLGGAAVVTSMVLTGAGVVAATGAPYGGFVAAPPVPDQVVLHPLPIDVISGRELHLTTGRVIDLAGIDGDRIDGTLRNGAEVRGAWRVTGGWLIETRQSERSAVWFVDQGGRVEALAEGQRVAVGNGSFREPRVAWGDGDRVSYATFRDGALLPAIETGGVGGLLPVMVAGTGVLLGSGETDKPVYDMWFPARGNFVPGPQVTHSFIGLAGDGGSLLGVVNDPELCLAKIEPMELHRSQRLACELDITPTLRLFASPDPKWFVAVGGDQVELHDAAAMWTGALPVARWPIAASQAVWLPDGSFVVDSGGDLVRLFVDTPERRERTPVGDGLDGGLILVTDLR